MKRPLWEKTSSFLSSLVNSMETEAQATKEQVQETTSYWVDTSDGKHYLQDTHPDVIAVTILAGEFAQLINNRNFEALDGRVEYHLYSPTYLAEVESKQDEKTTVKYIKKHKIKSRCEGSIVQAICFNAKMDQVEVLLRVQITVTEASDKFFKLMNKGLEGKALGKNVPYAQLYKLNLCKEQVGWKICGFEADSEISVLGD